MNKKLGIFFVVLGILVMTVAAAVFGYHKDVQLQAQRSVEAVMPKVAEAIGRRAEDEKLQEDIHAFVPEHIKNEKLDVVEVEGNGYIGVIGFPERGFELPVLSDWSNELLAIAPCRFFGEVSSNDLVIMAHNYTRHFGFLSNLHTGEIVTFTDMNGKVTEYEVIATDVLSATDVENMTAGEYDLTLFTCNYSGKSRVTVRLDRTET